MEKIQKSIEVDRPIRSVYNQWTHFEEFPRFIEGVKQVGLVSRRIENDLDHFKDFIENRGQETGAWRAFENSSAPAFV